MKDRKKSVAETYGWYLFQVHFVLSYKGKDFKDDKGELIEIVLEVDTLDLEEVFYNVQEDIVNQQLGGFVFDAWRPYRILEYTWKDKEEHKPFVADRNIEPFLVWSEEDNGTFH